MPEPELASPIFQRTEILLELRGTVEIEVIKMFWEDMNKLPKGENLYFVCHKRDIEELKERFPFLKDIVFEMLHFKSNIPEWLRDKTIQIEIDNPYFASVLKTKENVSAVERETKTSLDERDIICTFNPRG